MWEVSKNILSTKRCSPSVLEFKDYVSFIPVSFKTLNFIDAQ